MTTAAEIQTKVDKFVVNMGRLDDFVNADNTTDVTVDTGTIPSLSKFRVELGLATRGGVQVDTYAALAALTGVYNGQPGTVILDAGTHTDRITGAAGTANQGLYAWYSTGVVGAGWKWVGVDAFTGVSGDGITDPFTIIAFGDSQMIGNTLAVGGADATNAQCYFWNYTAGAWKNDALGVHPFREGALPATPNNLMRAFAHRVQEERGGTVRVIMRGVPGSSYADWTDSAAGPFATPNGASGSPDPESDGGWNNLKTDVAAAFATAELTGKAHADLIVALVGSNNGALEVSQNAGGNSGVDYIKAIAAQCRNTSILPKGGADTPFIGIEMARNYNNTSIQIHAWRKVAQERLVENFALASSEGCTFNRINQTTGAIGDFTHYDGAGLQQLGYHALWDAYSGLVAGGPYKASKRLGPWRVEVPGNSTTAGAANNTSQVFTISNASPAVVTYAGGGSVGHNLHNGNLVYITTTGTLPSPLSIGRPYYIINTGGGTPSTTFQLSLSPGGVAINTTTAGSGVHTIGSPFEVARGIPDIFILGNAQNDMHVNFNPTFYEDGATFTVRNGTNTATAIALGTPPAKVFIYAASDEGPTFTVTIANPAVFTCNNHGLYAGQRVHLVTTGLLPTGLAPHTSYIVLSAGWTPNSFRLSTTVGGTAIATTGSQSGVHTVAKSSRLEIPGTPGIYTTAFSSTPYVTLNPGEVITYRRIETPAASIYTVNWEVLNYVPGRQPYICLVGDGSASHAFTTADIFDKWTMLSSSGISIGPETTTVLLDTVAGEITIERDGIYVFTGSIWPNASSAGRFQVQRRPLGGAYGAIGTFDNGGTTEAYGRATPINLVYPLNGGDTIRVIPALATITTASQDPTAVNLSIYRLPC